MTFSISIVRQKSTIHGTPGTLKTNAGFTCSTLELPWEDNKSGISCIIADVRVGALWESPSLYRLVVRLDDAHGRKDCLIHNANWGGEGDGDVTQIHGCTAVGEGYGQLQNSKGNMQFAVLNSGHTLSALILHIQQNKTGDTFPVTYSWADGCEPTECVI